MDWTCPCPLGDPPDECALKCAIKTGHFGNISRTNKIYRCPTGNKGEAITYVVVDGINGLPRANTKAAGVWIKNRNAIRKTAKQVVFIDEGKVSPDSYAVNYKQVLRLLRENGGTTRWFDTATERCFLADGHTEWWRWRSKWTINLGLTLSGSTAPPDDPSKNDLYQIQIGCWSKLGYKPTAAKLMVD